MDDTRICAACGAEFSENPGTYSSGRFCSKKCARSYAAKLGSGKTKKSRCAVCGRRVVVPSRAGRVLCEKCKKERARSRQLGVPASAGEKHDSEFLRLSELDKTRNGSGIVSGKKSRKLALDLKAAGKLPEWLSVDRYGFVSVDRDMLEDVRDASAKGAAVFEISRLVKSSGYLYCVSRGHPRANKNGYVFLHDVIMENLSGETMDGVTRVVHHKDGDRFNNSPDNLVMMSNAEHAKLHRDRTCSDVVYTLFRCPWCGSLFARRKSARVSGVSYLACSSKCRGKISSARQYGKVDDKLAAALSKNIVRDDTLFNIIAEFPDVIVK